MTKSPNFFDATNKSRFAVRNGKKSPNQETG